MIDEDLILRQVNRRTGAFEKKASVEQADAPEASPLVSALREQAGITKEARLGRLLSRPRTTATVVKDLLDVKKSPVVEKAKKLIQSVGPEARADRALAKAERSLRLTEMASVEQHLPDAIGRLMYNQTAASGGGGITKSVKRFFERYGRPTAVGLGAGVPVALALRENKGGTDINVTHVNTEKKSDMAALAKTALGIKGNNAELMRQGAQAFRDKAKKTENPKKKEQYLEFARSFDRARKRYLVDERRKAASLGEARDDLIDRLRTHKPYHTEARKEASGAYRNFVVVLQDIEGALKKESRTLLTGEEVTKIADATSPITAILGTPLSANEIIDAIDSPEWSKVAEMIVKLAKPVGVSAATEALEGLFGQGLKAKARRGYMKVFKRKRYGDLERANRRLSPRLARRESRLDLGLKPSEALHKGHYKKLEKADKGLSRFEIGALAAGGGLAAGSLLGGKKKRDIQVTKL